MDEFGLYGDGGLAKTFAPEKGTCSAMFDESNAFTAVVVPFWLTYWQCCPPIRAGNMWEILPAEMEKRVTQSDYLP